MYKDSQPRRLLNRAQYLAVVEAKRAAASPTIGERSPVTGKYEASEPDGSKVFGVKIDNSQPDGNPVQSIKNDAGQLYLQGPTAPPKPKFGEPEVEAVAPKLGTDVPTIISPFSKGDDSLSAQAIDNAVPGADGKGDTPPTHIGNELGYLNGQIYTVEKPEEKVTYAYYYYDGFDTKPFQDQFITDFNRPKNIYIKFEFRDPIKIYSPVSDSLWFEDVIANVDNKPHFRVTDLFLLSSFSAIVSVQIDTFPGKKLEGRNEYTFGRRTGYKVFFILGDQVQLIAELKPVTVTVPFPFEFQFTGFPTPTIDPNYQQYLSFIPTYPNGYSRLEAPIYQNFAPDNYLIPPSENLPFTGFSPSSVEGFKPFYSDGRGHESVNLINQDEGYFSFIKTSDNSTLPTEHYIYKVNYNGEFSFLQTFKKVKIANFESPEKANYPKFLVYKNASS